MGFPGGLNGFLKEAKDNFEVGKATLKTIGKRAIGDDSPTKLPVDTQKRIEDRLKQDKAKNVTNK